MAAVSAAQAPLKILCLHGFGMNASSMRGKTSALRKALQKVGVELEYLEGPVELASDPASTDPAPPKRSWWVSSDDGSVYDGWEQAVASVKRKMKEDVGNYIGILGFSQGATFAAILSALRDRPDYTAPGSLPFRFAVMYSGFIPRCPELQKLLAHKPAAVPVPSLHIIGETDEVVPASRSHDLAGCFVEPTVHTHGGGHYMPSTKDDRSAVLDFVTRFVEEEVKGEVS